MCERTSPAGVRSHRADASLRLRSHGPHVRPTSLPDPVPLVAVAPDLHRHAGDRGRGGGHAGGDRGPGTRRRDPAEQVGFQEHQHGVGPGGHRGGGEFERHARVARSGHARSGRRAVRARRGAAGDLRRAGAAERDDRLGPKAGSGVERRAFAGARGRALPPPHRARRRRHDRARAAAVPGGESPRDGRDPDLRALLRVGPDHADVRARVTVHGRNHAPRQVRAAGDLGEGDDPGVGRERGGVSRDDQPTAGHVRRRGDGVPRGRDAGGRGVRAVSSDDAVPPRRLAGAYFRGGAGRRGVPARRQRAPVHAGHSSAG